MKNKIKSFDEFINENYQTDPLYDIAAEVYDMIDYRDLENKTKVRSALKKLGYGTDPITVGRVMRKIQQVINEKIDEGKGSKYLPYKVAKEIANKAGGVVIDAEDDMKELFISYDNGDVPKKKVKDILKKYDLQDLLDEYEKRLNESNWDVDELKKTIKDLQDKIKKQGNVTNARDEEHLEKLLGIYKELTGETLNESREHVKLDSDTYLEISKDHLTIHQVNEFTNEKKWIVVSKEDWLKIAEKIK